MSLRLGFRWRRTFACTTRSCTNGPSLSLIPRSRDDVVLPSHVTHKTQGAEAEDSDTPPPFPAPESSGDEDVGSGDDDDVSTYSMPEEEEEEEESETDEELEPIRRRRAGRGGGPAVYTFKWDPADYNFNGYFASSPEPSPETSSTGARSLNDAARAGASAAAGAAALNPPARHPHKDTPRPVRQAGPFRTLSGQAPVVSTPRVSAASARSSVTITASTPPDEVFVNLRLVASPETTSGLAGQLLPHVAPSFVKLLVNSVFVP